MSANWNYYFTNLLCYGLILPDCLTRKKIKNVCAVFWVPTLPYKNKEF